MPGPTKPAFALARPLAPTFYLTVSYTGGGSGDAVPFGGDTFFMGAGGADNLITVLQTTLNDNAASYGHAWTVTLDGQNIVISAEGGSRDITDIEFLTSDLTSADLGFKLAPGVPDIQTPTTSGSGAATFVAAYSPRWRWRPDLYLAADRLLPRRSGSVIVTDGGEVTTVVKGQYSEREIVVEYVTGDRAYKWCVQSDYLAVTLPQNDVNGCFEQLWQEYGDYTSDNGVAPVLRYVPDETAPTVYHECYMVSEDQFNDVSACFEGEAESTPIYLVFRLFLIEA